MPFKAKDLTVKIKLPAIQIITMADTATVPDAGDIGGRVYDDGVYIGKLLGFEDLTNDKWYVETLKTVASDSTLTIAGGTGTGTTSGDSVAGIQIYLELDTYTDCVRSDIGKIVTDDTAVVGPLVDYDNEGQRWVIACATGTQVTDGSAMAITGGTGAGNANGNSIEEVALTVVEGMSIELLYEGGMEYLFGRESEVGVGPKHATFTLRRWFYDDNDKDILFDLFNDKVSFDLEGTITGQSNSTIRIRKCKALRWRPITGTANDTVAEEIVGEAESWVKTTPTD